MTNTNVRHYKAIQWWVNNLKLIREFWHALSISLIFGIAKMEVLMNIAPHSIYIGCIWKRGWQCFRGIGTCEFHPFIFTMASWMTCQHYHKKGGVDHLYEFTHQGQVNTWASLRFLYLCIFIATHNKKGHILILSFK